MTFNIHKASDRGTANHGWLKATFSFSFSQYYDESRMGFGPLRVLNDDIISANSGFPNHPHANMEIITLVLEGELTHTDSMGNKEILHPNDMQIMSAGSGVTHSEFNHSENEVKLFQIWIEPKTQNIEPSHKTFSLPTIENDLLNVIPEIKSIEQDAELFIGKFEKNQSLNVKANGQGLFLMLIEGSIEVNGKTVSRRDSIETTDDISITVSEDAYFFVFRVPFEK